MKNCPFCKEAISPDARFCNHCGKSIETNIGKVPSDQEEQQDRAEQLDESITPPLETKEEVSEHQTEQATELEEPSVTPAQPIANQQAQQASPVNTKPKGKNKNKLYLSLIAIIAVLGIALYMVGDSLTSEDKIIDNFQKAVEDGDVKELKSLLQSDDSKMKITDEGIEGFIALYESSPSELKDLVKHLRREAKGRGSSYQMYPVSIKKDGKKWLVYDNYKLTVSPVYFNIDVNYEGTTIYVGDEEVATADSDYYDVEVGPFMPGEYTIRGVLDNGFSNLDVEETVSNSDPESSKWVSLYIDASTVYFSFDDYGYYDLNEIRLYINGNETDFNLIEDNVVGPLLTDGSMNASFEAEFPWGTILTNEVPIDSSDITVNLADSPDFQEHIIDIVLQYNTEFIELFTQVSAEHLTTVSIEFAEILMDEAMAQLDSGYEYQAAFHGAEFYLDSFYLTKNYNDIWFVEVDGIAYFEEAFYEDGDQGELEQIEDETRFILGYDQSFDEWIVTGIDYPGYMDENDMERYVVEDPEVFTSIWNESSDKDKDKKDKKDKQDKKDKD